MCLLTFLSSLFKITKHHHHYLKMAFLVCFLPDLSQKIDCIYISVSFKDVLDVSVVLLHLLLEMTSPFTDASHLRELE